MCGADRRRGSMSAGAGLVFKGSGSTSPTTARTRIATTGQPSDEQGESERRVEGGGEQRVEERRVERRATTRSRPTRSRAPRLEAERREAAPSRSRAPRPPSSKPSSAHRRRAAQRMNGTDLLRAELDSRAAQSLGAPDDVEPVLERPRDPVVRRLGDEPRDGAREAARQEAARSRDSDSSSDRTSRARDQRRRRSPARASSTSALDAGRVRRGIARDRRGGRRSTAARDAGQRRTVNVEFVSANPTGPLHVGHGRQAALGDAIAALLECDRLARHARVLLQRRRRADRESRAAACRRACAQLGGVEALAIPEGGYHGEYIREIAQRYVDEHPTDPDGRRPRRGAAVRRAASCARSRTSTSRRSASSSTSTSSSRRCTPTARVDDAIERARRGRAHVREGRRALAPHHRLRRRQGSRHAPQRGEGRRADTYFLPDVAYHVTKWERGFTRAINVQGADHHSTVTRVRVGSAGARHGHSRGLSRVRAAPDGDGDARAARR